VHPCPEESGAAAFFTANAKTCHAFKAVPINIHFE
jgi:hypothetical protein